MKLLQDTKFLILVAILIGVLLLASLIGFILSRRVTTEKGQAVVANLNARIKAWWVMVAVFLLAVTTGPTGSIVLFALVSFLALREYFALSPTLRSDHRVLVWLIFVILEAVSKRVEWLKPT